MMDLREGKDKTRESIQVEPAWEKRFEQLQACVLVPTYNNATTLAPLLEDIARYTRHIMVINDGSTDQTEFILESFPFVKKVSYPVNKGKGWALRSGFIHAQKNGYRYAISIDSDGQHFASDLPAFLEKLEQEKNAIVIGSRNMDQSAVPGKSSFGNRFSNFWFRVETGISLPDTQSGYRLYPLVPLSSIHFLTRKYEFEIEVIVRSAWRGVKVESVPVRVYYPPKNERVSHFRPFKDFTRISLLNTVLVLIAFFYIKPRNFLRTLFDSKKNGAFIREHLFNQYQPDYIKVLSVGLGVFMGIIPVWGFQLVLAIFLAIVLRLNKALVIIAANISIPPMIPLIIFLSYRMGGIWMGERATHIAFSRDITLSSIRRNFEQYLYGSITLALAAGILSAFLIFLLLSLFKRKTATVR